MLSTPKPPTRLHRRLRIVLLSAALLIPAHLMREKSITIDEVAHLPAGYSYLTTGFVKLNPMHPPLIKEICAAPLLVVGEKVPVDAKALAEIDVPISFQWAFGREFLLKQDLDHVLFWARLPVAVLSAGLAGLVTVWASELWGSEAGLLALFLYVLDPTITAHSQLVTTDVGMAFFATLFLYLLRKHFAAPSAPLLILTGIALGLALGSKFSAVLLIPIALLLGSIHAVTDSRTSNRSVVYRLAVMARNVGSMIAVAYVVLWAVYLFPRDPFFYLKGIETVNLDHRPHFPWVIMGKMTEHRWLSYFLVAWLIKTPLAFLLLLLGAIVALLRGYRVSWIEEAFLLVPAIGFFVLTSLLADPIGVRYLIPAFPFLFVFAARIAPALKWTSIRAAVAVALVWYAVEFAVVWPDHLSYFNELAGGTRHGPEWLDDSNVDWGQGLIQLRDYVNANGIRDYHLWHFGVFPPERYGILGKAIKLDEVTSYPSAGIWIFSSHWVARARSAFALEYGDGPQNWIAHTEPKAIVGHAFYVYEISP